MTQSQRKRLDDKIARRERLDDDLARKWLQKHAPNPKPKLKPLPLERWQICVRVQKQERRVLSKPLLKGVE